MILFYNCSMGFLVQKTLKAEFKFVTRLGVPTTYATICDRDDDDRDEDDRMAQHCCLRHRSQT